MSLTICKKCGAERDGDLDFYKSRPRVCKTCIREQARSYYHDNKEKFIKWQRENRDRTRQYNRNDNKLKRKARSKVAYAIKTGKLLRKTICEECGEDGSLHAHHDDYSKPLDVRFLCRKCHSLLHRKDK